MQPHFKPVLYSPEMVYSILQDNKTQTRRIIKNNNIQATPTKFIFFAEAKICSREKPYDNKVYYEFQLAYNNERSWVLTCPYGKPGDILWVRETWAHTKQIHLSPDDDNYGIVYKGDMQPWEDYAGWKWKSSLFMPKELCRLFLRVKSIRPELLHNISDQDCVKEGIHKIEGKGDIIIYKDYLNPHSWTGFKKGDTDRPEFESFKSLWIKINGSVSWGFNPWVWVIEFERIAADNIILQNGQFSLKQ